MQKRIAKQMYVWMREKAREQAALAGTQHAARNLRKRGVPVVWAVAMLATKG